MDLSEVTSLILLDLSAACDTVNHSILPQNWFGLDCLTLDWFTSYLSSRFQAFSINDSISAFSALLFFVPHGPAHCSLLSILFLLARLSQKIPPNSICTLMTASLIHSYKFCSISWYTYHHFHWHPLLDEIEQTAPQSIKNWISSHWHKTTTSKIFWSNKLITQQWHHPSQFLCSQSRLHL